jgi:LysR family transcriptional regulator (chromosome initiation inhibitor)
MSNVTPEQARTLAAIADLGSFDAAAAVLGVTPSAVSQRVRALQVAVGRPVLRQVRPVELTESGRAVVRFARQLELLTTDLSAELAPATPDALPRLTVVVNSDSLHTWALAGLADVAGRVQLEVVREDQEHSLDLLREGRAAAAVTAVAAPVPGCTSAPLGVMRYRPVCTPAFAAEWFRDGVTGSTLGRAPVLAYDRKDDLQDRYLRGHAPLSGTPPRHHIPASAEFAEAIRLGLGWGMLPELELDQDLRHGVLRPLAAHDVVDVPLHWQQWRTRTRALDQVAAAVRAAARVLATST